jgi:hypothetical protein
MTWLDVTAQADLVCPAVTATVPVGLGQEQRDHHAAKQLKLQPK